MTPPVDPAIAKALSDLVARLSLPADAAPKDIITALESYLASVSADDAQLSTAQRKICRDSGITSAAFLALKNRASR